MTTDKQLEANRNNTQLSTGPRTEEGKNRSRLNAKRHGLTGQVSTMTEEDRAAHDKFSKSLIDDLAPSGAMETQLALRIATDSWRLNRLSAIEDNIYALGFWSHSGEMNAGHPQIDAALAMAVTFTGQSAELQRLSLYEQRLNRAVQKNLAELKKLQAERKALEAAQLEEAKLLLQLAEKEGTDYQPDTLSAQAGGPLCAENENAQAGGPLCAAKMPAEEMPAPKNGFVFSISEIRAAIARDRRLHEARHTDFRPSKPGPALTQAA